MTSGPITLASLLPIRSALRAAGKRVVCTNGVFDLLHYGHLEYLRAARALGDVLIVGLNSDQSTRSYKGPRRPLVAEHERAMLLLALEPVDYVTIFDTPTAKELLEALQPEIYVKGGDYAAEPDATAVGTKSLPETPVVRAYGGRIEIIPYLAGHSTSALIDRIVALYCS